MASLYDLSFTDPSGKEISLQKYRDNVLLIVNTATQCGLKGQFSELEELHQRYKERGLVVIGFPCGQFAGQEPETNENMVETCQVNFGVTFQLSAKIDVNGSHTNDVFRYLKKHTGSMFGSRIKWNFTKFLVAPREEKITRYSPTTHPRSFENEIKELLQ